MNPGDLNDRVNLHHRTATDPVTGDAFTLFASVWARFKPVVSSEYVEGAERLGQQRGTFLIIYRDDVVLTDQLVFAGKRWDITAVDRVGFKEATLLTAYSVGDAP
jgi:SPP1 family predicted phage head-tail adaptor